MTSRRLRGFRTRFTVALAVATGCVVALGATPAGADFVECRGAGSVLACAGSGAGGVAVEVVFDAPTNHQGVAVAVGCEVLDGSTVGYVVFWTPDFHVIHTPPLPVTCPAFP